MSLCAIFDMDGVIIDSEPLHMMCEREIFKMLGIHITKDEHHSFTGANDEALWSMIKNKYDLPLKVTDLIDLKRTKYLDFLKNDDLIKIIPNIHELIFNLYSHGFLIVLASSSPKAQIDYVLKKFNLEAYFHGRISGDDVESSKPNPEIFLNAAKLVNAKPNCCVVIEDSYNGVMAAKSAGMKCVGFKNPNSGNQNLQIADIILSSFAELSISKIEVLLMC